MDSNVPVEALDGGLPNVSHASMELDTGVEDLVGELTYIGLHHRDLFDGVVALFHQPTGVVNQLPSGL